MFANDALINPQQHFAVLGALFAIAFFGFWAEKQAWGKLVTGAVWAILGAILASNLNLIPKDAPAYGIVFSYLVPMLIPLFLMKADVRRIIAESGRVGIGFILACLGTAVGAIVASSLLDLGAREGDLAGIFTATYTGGSVNYAAVIQATGFDDKAVISAATAVDNLMSALFLAVLAIMPASMWLLDKFAKHDNTLGDAESIEHAEHNVSGFSIAASITFALVIVALSDGLVALLKASIDTEFNIGSLRYVFITLFSVLPATFLPKQMSKMQGGQSLGVVLAFVFFAAIAAGADIGKLIDTAPILIGFVLILLFVHGLVLFGGGALLCKLLGKKSTAAPTLPELIIASNAAILGATTAPALAMARGWTALVTPGILVGVAGYIVGTPLGLTIAALLG